MSLAMRRVIALVCLLLVTLPVSWGSAAEAKRVAILVSNKTGPYEDMLTGFQQSLQRQGVPFSLQRYMLEGDAATAGRALQDISQNKVDLLLTLGTFATQQALQAQVASPIVAGLIVNKEVLAGADNASGVVLEFPLDVQFQWMRRFLPTAKTVGVVYNPAENQQQIEAAQAFARTVGLTLEPRPIHAVRELPMALDSLAFRVDALWSIIDAMVLTPQTAKNVLLFSFQQRIPFVGLSATWVKAGALYALDWDYVDMGQQCGDIALQVFQGVQAKTIPPQTPRKVLYTLNQKTARHMKAELAKSLIRGAREVF